MSRDDPELFWLLQVPAIPQSERLRSATNGSVISWRRHLRWATGVSVRVS